MRVACLGGGPAGLYFAIVMKLRNPGHDIVVIERNRPYDTFGWGVVLSDETLANLRASDPISAEDIRRAFVYWDDIAVFYRGSVTRSSGHGFCGIGRKRLLNILQDRARALGVNLKFETEIEHPGAYRDYDLVVAADGANSKIRSALAHVFQPDIDVRACKYIWLGTQQTFQDAFTFLFEETEHGWIWAHAYQFDTDTATFIIESSEATWRRFGFDRMGPDETTAACERIFARHLGGHPLATNARHLRGSAWLNFRRVLCEKWSHDNIVLMGDAAATAHFSVGSGTKLALESAAALAEYLHTEPNVSAAFNRYEEERRTEVLRLQSAARNSTEWFEHVERYLHLDPVQFNYSLLTRSQRIGHENLRARDKVWLESAERWFEERATGEKPDQSRPPMFTPFRLRDLCLKNRIVVSPMAQYRAIDGTPTEWHLVHYAERAKGGAGLVTTEMTCVSAQGRISPGCAGLYAPEHEAAWKRIVDFVHAETDAKIGIQLGHSGPKGSTQLGWETSDAPLLQGNWPVIAPSPIAWSPENQIPREMTRHDMEKVRDEFLRAVDMAIHAGFDLLELHFAHGYLLSAFITPLTNRRTDAYGGSLENRMRFPLELCHAVRGAWPSAKPLSVRISASDWVGESGIGPEDAVAIARMLSSAGVDIIDVSAGQTSTRALPVYGRMFQTPFSDRIRNEAGIATMAVGNIYEPDHVNSILMAGRADLCCLARPHLADPYWTLHAAAQLGYRGETWPKPYLQGRDLAAPACIALRCDSGDRVNMRDFRPKHFNWRVDGSIAVVSLARPERKNPLTFDSYAELRDAFRALGSSDDIKAVVIASNGGNFSSGGDVHEIIGPLLKRDMKGLVAFTRMTGDLVKALRACPQPIVAAVDGVCVGAGAMVALFADLRLGTPQAKTAFLFTRVGLAGCDMGACAMLPRVVGQGRAAELLFTGRTMSAEEGERWGFFNRIVASDILEHEAIALAQGLADGPTFAHMMTKTMLNQEWSMALDQAIEAEAQAQAICMQTRDFKRAYDAFLAKQKPKFEGD